MELMSKHYGTHILGRFGRVLGPDLWSDPDVSIDSPTTKFGDSRVCKECVVIYWFRLRFPTSTS